MFQFPFGTSLISNLPSASVTAKYGWSNTRARPAIHGWMSHLNVTGDDCALSGLVFLSPFGGRLTLNSLSSALKLMLWLTGALFLNSITSPARAATTRGTNWQHGWSISIVFGAALARPG